MKCSRHSLPDSTGPFATLHFCPGLPRSGRGTVPNGEHLEVEFQKTIGVLASGAPEDTEALPRFGG
jgi:hypothetical protein